MNTSAFLAVFAGYVILMIALGWFVSRRHKSGEDFLLGGRSLPVLLTLGTTVATMVGTGSSMGAVGFGYSHGWAGALYGVGGATGILLTAWWFAQARRLRFMTMSEELSYYVGANRYVKNVIGVLIFIASIGWLGAHILGGGMYLAWVADIEIQIAKLLVALGFAVYIIIGGYTAVVWTDTVQAIILFIGFILMALLAISQAGGMAEILSAQPVANTSFFAIDKLGVIPAISLAAVIAVGVLATPSFRQRIYSARSVSAVRVSFVWSGVLYLLFSLVPAIVGMAAFSINPDLANKNFAFPYMAIQVLPVFFGVIVLIAGLSATMSSASSDAIAGVSILLRDIYILFVGSVPSAAKMILYSRIALVGVIGLALLFALTSDDIITYITKMIATVMSGMFVCGLLGRFWSRYNWQGAIASLISASLTSIAVLMQPDWTAFWGNPVIPSVTAAIAMGVLVSLLTPVCRVSSEQALRLLSEERQAMEKVASS